MDKKIVLIGAGSAAFGPPTFVDLNLSKVLVGSTITIVDIDTEKLQMVYEVLSEDNRKIGNKFNVECTSNREKALKGADFVLEDFSIAPAKFLRLLRLLRMLKEYVQMLFLLIIQILCLEYV